MSVGGYSGTGIDLASEAHSHNALRHDGWTGCTLQEELQGSIVKFQPKTRTHCIMYGFGVLATMLDAIMDQEILDFVVRDHVWNG